MSRRRRIAAVLVAFAALGSGCGIAADEEPRAIPEGALPESLVAPATTTTLPGTIGTVDRTVWFVRSEVEQLASLEVPVPIDEGNPIGAALRALVAAAPADEGLTNAIPPGTEVLAADLDTASGVLTINLSETMGEVEGDRQVNAFAQLVFTATEFPTVTGGVRFLIDGQARSTPTAGGTQPANEPVDRDDYRRVDPSVPPTTVRPTPTTAAPAPAPAGSPPATTRSSPPAADVAQE